MSVRCKLQCALHGAPETGHTAVLLPPMLAIGATPRETGFTSTKSRAQILLQDASLPA
ncbi:hypothetical protein CBM2629_B10039 [Cupriavidus taiwanensis]|nr:hypothetical protein CBM2629_B10039 [Cupriavidus taiwanensis]